MLGDNEHDAREDGGPDKTPVRAQPRGGGNIVVADRGRYPSYEWMGDDGKNESSIDLQKYLRVILRHWLIIAACVALAITAGIVKTLLTTPIFTAGGTLKIDREASRVVGVNPQETPQSGGNGEEFLQTQYLLLKSWALADMTAKDPALGLSRDTAFLKSIGIIQEGQRAPTTAQAQEALTGYIQGHITVTPLQRSRLVRLSVDTPNPQASARIVNAVSENFIRYTLESRKKTSYYALTFLQQQLQAEKIKLEAAEKMLADYARSQQIINLSSGTGGATGESGGGSGGGSASGNQTLAANSLSAMMNALNNARSARILAESRWRQGMAAIGPNAPEVLQSPNIQALKQNKFKLVAEYEDKRAIYNENYPPLRELKTRIDETERQIQTEIVNVQSSLTGSLESQYRIAKDQEDKLDAQVRALTSNVLDMRSRSVQYDILNREVESSRQIYESLLQGFKEVNISSNLSNNNISIVDPARVPGGPSKPNLRQNLLLSAFLGLLAGVGLAFLIEFMDESIRSPEDVEKKLGLTLLGTIPKLEKGIEPIVALADVRSAFSESYYSVRTALQFSTNEGVPSSLVITSARPSEGKSTSSMAVAQNFARLGSRVLLIDSDLRNPSLHRVFKAENTEGLSNYLTGGQSLRQLAQATETANLFFIPCGPLPPNPAELLGGVKLEELLQEAREHFDMVVIDAPPVMGLADAPLLASAAAGCILVVEAGGTGRNLAKAAIRRLTVGNAHLLGVLLTKFDARKGSYGYGYGYGYAYDYDYGTRPRLTKGGS